jgi:predicted metal-binding membrane protein
VSTRALLWPAFFAGVLLAWAALWAMGQEARGLTSVYGAELWAALCRSGAADVAFPALAAMWAVMAAAMMAPTFVPALRTFLALPAPAGGAGQAAALVASYLAVWLAAALGFAALQLALSSRGLVAPDASSLSLPLSAALLAVAGAYQFAPLKSACLSRCRAPLSLFLASWRPGLRPAFSLGLRMGADCLGCCWALMLLAFVGGMGNLLFMGLATLLMVMEKLPEFGRPLTRPLGVVLLVSAGAVLLRTLGG